MLLSVILLDNCGKIFEKMLLSVILSGLSSSSQPSRGRRSPWGSPPCSTWRWPFFLYSPFSISGTLHIFNMTVTFLSEKKTFSRTIWAMTMTVPFRELFVFKNERYVAIKKKIWIMVSIEICQNWSLIFAITFLGRQKALEATILWTYLFVWSTLPTHIQA